MPEKLVIQYCAPTLAGLKTGSLFVFSHEGEDIQSDLEQWNRRFQSKGLRIMLLGTKNNKALIYVYRPKKLISDLSIYETRIILEERGYELNEENQCLETLKEHLKKDDTFPHEIGCFLGYPPEDVDCFIKKDKPCKLTGIWKVYGNEKKAKKLFEQYEKCTNIYLQQYEKGIQLEQLTVVV